MYAVCFYLDCFCHCLTDGHKKADLLLKVDLFLFQNLPIIARSLRWSMLKVLEKYFIFLLDNQRKAVIITRGLIL